MTTHKLTNNEYIVRLLNVGLRGVTLLCKFSLFFVLAFYLAPEEVGLYGLIVASIAYGIYPLGLEFYTYSTRELIKSDKSTCGRYLASQIRLYVVLYLVFLPLFLLLFYFNFLPWYVAVYFYVLLILEHANQEMMRLLIALSHQIAASVALFLRQGLWVLIVIPVMYFYPDYRSIDFILSLWVLGSIGAAAVSFVTFYNLGFKGWLSGFDWLWIKKGVLVSLPFFISTLSLSAIATFDRYLFDFFVGRDVLGAYVFYIGLAASLISFLDAAVFSFIYPKMIAAYAKEDLISFNSQVKKMFYQMLTLSFIFFAASFLLIDLIVGWIDKPIYSEHIFIFYIVVIAMFLQALSYIPHYALYAQGCDNTIIMSHGLSVVIFMISAFSLSYISELYAVPVALCITYFLVLVWKTSAYYKRRLFLAS